MDGRTIDASDVFERGLKNPDALTEAELMVFLFLDLQIIMEMEGWDHFFATDRMRFYPQLKSGLQRIGDAESLRVIEDYEALLGTHGVPMESDAIDSYVCGGLAEDDTRDWREEYLAHTEQRWELVRRYLVQRGFQLIG